MARRPWDRKALIDKSPFLLVALLAAGLYGLHPGSLHGLSPDSGSGGYERPWLLVANYRLLAFAGHVFLPVKLSLIYPQEYLLAKAGFWLKLLPLMTLGIGATLIRWRETMPAVTYGVAFFAITISPALAMPGAGSNFLSDRYTYIPSIGLLLGILYLVARFTGRAHRQWVALVLVVVVLILANRSSERCRVWRNSEALWTDVIDKFPDQVGEAYVGRGNLYFRQEQYDLALGDYDQALRINHLLPKAYANRGSLFARQGDPRRAVADFDRALALDEKLAQSYLQRAMAYTLLEDHRRAEKDYQRYFSWIDDDPKAYLWRGLSRHAEGRHREALQDFSRAIELEPRRAALYRARAESYRALGREEAAARDLDAARALRDP